MRFLLCSKPKPDNELAGREVIIGGSHFRLNVAQFQKRYGLQEKPHQSGDILGAYRLSLVLKKVNQWRP